jgi:transposase
VKVEHRTSQPSAALIDSQSVRAAETVGRASRGYDVGKNVNGRKRHIVTDTCRLLLAVAVTGANVQQTGGVAVLVDWAATTLALTVQIVARLAGQTTFIVLPPRWCVERTFSWINRCRRTVRDYERLPQHHAAMIQWAMIALMTRRLAHHHT